MISKLIVLLTVLLVSTVPVQAGFVNGDFETGDMTGWTVSGDHSVISSFTPQFTVTDATWNPNIPYYGTYSLLLGSGDVGTAHPDGGHVSTASQIATVSQLDIDSGLHLFLKWGAILEEPTNNVFHADDDQPYFSVRVSTFDGVWASLYFEDQRANEAGFSLIGTNAFGDAGEIFFGTGITDIDLTSSGLVAGDLLKIELYVQDCGLGGHGGLVFLDGFGTVRPPDPVVPEPGTLVLMGSGLIGIAGAYLRKRK